MARRPLDTGPLSDEDVQPPRDYALRTIHVRAMKEGVPSWLVSFIGAIIIAELTWFGLKVVNMGETLSAVQTEITSIDKRVTRLEDKK